MGGVGETEWVESEYAQVCYRVCWVLHSVEWPHSKWILVQDIEVSVVLRWKYVAGRGGRERGREGEGGRGRGER